MMTIEWNMFIMLLHFKYMQERNYYCLVRLSNQSRRRRRRTIERFVILHSFFLSVLFAHLDHLDHRKWDENRCESFGVCSIGDVSSRRRQQHMYTLYKNALTVEGKRLSTQLPTTNSTNYYASTSLSLSLSLFDASRCRVVRCLFNTLYMCSQLPQSNFCPPNYSAIFLSMKDFFPFFFKVFSSIIGSEVFDKRTYKIFFSTRSLWQKKEQKRKSTII